MKPQIFLSRRLPDNVLARLEASFAVSNEIAGSAGLVTIPADVVDDALFEAATAVLAQQEATQPGRELSAFQSRTLAEGQSQFTGEPISLDLKDADIKDVFRTISQFTGLNIVIDPDVKGTVTVQLENVPWDQALDLILRTNGCGYVIEGNILRVGKPSNL